MTKPNEMNELNESDVISCYTRQEAIDDGQFIDASKVSKEAGIRFPVAITANLYHKYIKPDPMPHCQDEQGRLWDVLHMFKLAARKAKSSQIEFKVVFQMKDKQETVDIWAVCEATSPTDYNSAITILLPEDY